MRLLLPLLLATAAFCADTDGPACPATTKPFAPTNSDWNGWGLDTTNTRFQARPGLAAADVPKLKVKWPFAFQGDVRTVSQPTVMGGRVFVSSWGGKVYSLDAATGCTYWTYDAQSIARTAIQIVKDPQTNRYVAFFGSHPWAHAVDAETGKVLWKVRVDDHKEGRVTGAPMFYNGRVIVPVASGEEVASSAAKYECCTFRGSLVALDSKTGKQVWKTYTVPDPAKPYKKTADGTQLWGPAGAGIWSAPTIDEKRKRIYVGTGNSYTGIDIPTSDAILAFDLETGSLLWSAQVTPKDNWVPGCPRAAVCPENPGDDFDFGSSPVLRTMSNGKDVLLAGQKSGTIYGLDPDNRGKVIWKTSLGVGAGMLGGIGWGLAAEGQTVYVAVADYNKPNGSPGLYAININDGSKIWGTPSPKDAGNPAQASAVTAIPGIAFSSTYGGRLRAYDTKSGTIVWDFNAVQEYKTVNGVPSKGGSFTGSGPAVAGGMLFTTNGYGFAGGQPGNVLLAFSVDGK